MNVYVDKSIDKPLLELGDIVEYKQDSSFYLVIEEKGTHNSKGYIAKNLDGDGGAFGRYSTLEALNMAFADRTEKYNVYKKNEYDLFLKHKGAK
ncbi:hypothetical protein [Peribacillus muralis]|uniref:hypothetical protein n=1 Tax=Peribacillus muralis TaxID=264697 RepID=UPI00366D5808